MRRSEKERDKTYAARAARKLMGCRFCLTDAGRERHIAEAIYAAILYTRRKSKSKGE